MKKIVLTNDIDHGSLERYKMIYEALNYNDLSVDTAIFCKLEDDKSKLATHCYENETLSLDNKEFVAFVKDMTSCGHSFSYHGYSQISNTRQKFLDGLKIFEDLLGFRPLAYIEHGGKYGYHDEQMVKKETLSYLGSDEKSEYFVKDIISDYFDLVWTQDYLLEGNNVSPKLFKKIDNIVYFNRVRNVNLLKQIKNHEILIGYTHFGYDGYLRPKLDWIPFFKKDNRKLESWSNTKQVSDAIKILKNLVKEQNVMFSTLKTLLDDHKYELREK